MNEKLLNNANWLYDMYIVKELSAYKIAKIAKCSPKTVYRKMIHFGIDRRTGSEAKCVDYKDPKLKARIGKATKERWEEPKFRKKITKVLKNNLTNLWESEEFRESHSKRLSKRNVQNWKNADYREEMTKVLTNNSHNIWENDEFRKRKSASSSRQFTNYWKDPEYRHNMTGENAPGWKGGLSYEPYTSEFTEEFKEHIRKLQNRRCFMCGKRSRFRTKLDVHHIDYDKNNTTDENCVALCKSCHCKTNHNREEWVIWFRNELTDGN